MEYQEILNMLSELEMTFYYAVDRGTTPQIEHMHEELADLLEEWAEYSGDILGGNDTRRL